MLGEWVEQACALHHRIGVFRDAGGRKGIDTTMASSFSFPNKHAQLRWADLDLGEIVEFYVRDEDNEGKTTKYYNEDVDGGSQNHEHSVHSRRQAEDPSAAIAGWDWASGRACRGCLKGEQIQRQKQSKNQSQRQQATQPF